MDKLSIIIPAHNEQDRIGRTLTHYGSFFDQLTKSNNLKYELFVVLNGCTDQTLDVVQSHQKLNQNIRLDSLNLPGKGRAVIHGFKKVLGHNNDLIGFVDADMATNPVSFYSLIEELGTHDGIIASRYLQGATVKPPRPWIKRWGSRLVYEPLVSCLFGLHFKDLQCGAKLFKRKTVEAIVDQLSVVDWAIDVEMLYLCKQQGLSIKETPTRWEDQTGSKLQVLSSGLKMLKSLISIRLKHG